jgi:hypothetical protein
MGGWWQGFDFADFAFWRRWQVVDYFSDLLWGVWLGL